MRVMLATGIANIVKIKQQKFGIAFANNDNRGNIVYSFIYFEDLDLYYIEKINLAKLENFKFHSHENYWEIIKNFYKAGFDNDIILSSVNKLLSLSEEEQFSTIDICAIDTKKNTYDRINLLDKLNFTEKTL